MSYKPRCEYCGRFVDGTYMDCGKLFCDSSCATAYAVGGYKRFIENVKRGLDEDAKI